jgi:4-amino-4-deoxy-L-arabinose transferase-like glycosyltransferase
VPHGWWLVGPVLLAAAWQVARTGDRRLGVLLLWVGVLAGFYSVASTKLPWYVLPVQPAVALLLAHRIRSLTPHHLGVQTAVLAGTVLAVAAWNQRVVTPLDTARDVKAMSRAAAAAVLQSGHLPSIGFWDPAGTYQVRERPNFDVRPAVRFYADRPMVAITTPARLDAWLRDGGTLLWDDQTFPHAPVPRRTEVLATAGAQRLLRVVPDAMP